ncbi:MAG TPA: hypothetical protein DDY78_12120 [Planctomycetales bacterium]|nr:hypothetical protein [Planctomycetales bacterium]
MTLLASETFVRSPEPRMAAFPVPETAWPGRRKFGRIVGLFLPHTTSNGPAGTRLRTAAGRPNGKIVGTNSAKVASKAGAPSPANRPPAASRG